PARGPRTRGPGPGGPPRRGAGAPRARPRRHDDGRLGRAVREPRPFLPRTGVRADGRAASRAPRAGARGRAHAQDDMTPAWDASRVAWRSSRAVARELLLVTSAGFLHPPTP